MASVDDGVKLSKILSSLDWRRIGEIYGRVKTKGFKKASLNGCEGGRPIRRSHRRRPPPPPPAPSPPPARRTPHAASTQQLPAKPHTHPPLNCVRAGEVRSFSFKEDKVRLLTDLHAT